MLGNIEQKTIKVIAFIDPAVTCDEQGYAEYLETLDEDKLKLEGEPTRFELKTFLSGKDMAGLNDDMVSFDKEQNMKVKLSATNEEIRRALVGIENAPESLQFRREKGDPWCSREIIAMLQQIAVLPNLVEARVNAMKPAKEKQDLLKKS